MPRLLTVITLLIIAASSAPVPAGAADVREFILDNGLKVLLLEDHKSPVVTFQVWYRVGSRNEKDGKSGLSHFLEHMLFKGTPTTKPEEYSRIIAKNGGQSNAFTTTDMTVYFATMSHDKIGIQLQLEAERMTQALLGDAYFAAEKKVIQEERRLRTDDNPIAALEEATQAVAFSIHPYRRPVVGWMTDIESLTRRDLVEYYRTYYSPNNAFVVATGDFVAGELLAKIKAAFGKIKRGPEPPKVASPEPEQRGERRLVLKKEAELPFVIWFYRAPNLDDPDNFALDVLTLVLAGGRSSRLHHALVYEGQLARDVDASYNSVSIDPAGLSVSAQVMPGREPAAVERAIGSVVDALKSHLISEKELQKAKNQIEASFVFAQDSVFGQALKIGYYEITGGWRRMDGYLDGIRGVTREDVRRVAAKYLDPDRRTVGILVPDRRRTP